MTKEKGIPQIRFSGFTDTWEQRKLSDMVERVTRKNENRESELPLTISAQYGLIDQNEFFDKRIASRDVSGYYLLKKGEFAYNKSTSSDAPWGAVKRLDRYEMGVLSTLYIVFALKENGNIDSNFLVSYYDTDCWHKGVQAIAAEGARNHGLLNITPADYFETVLTVPSDVKEQHQIGSFFAKLDTLITLHQRKYDKLTKVKKAMLEKMFPKNGSLYPEIRFKGFTDAWEQRKCSDFIKLVGGATPSKANKDYWDGDIVWLSSQEIKGGFVSKGTYNITQKAVDDNTTKMIPANTPMFISRSGILANSFPITRALCDVAINQDIKALLFDHTVFSNDYIVHYLESKEQFILKSIVKSGTTVQSVSIPDFEKMPINIPASKDEQDRIGIYFENLDTLITLHQRKLEKLKNIKKACLEKMFV